MDLLAIYLQDHLALSLGGLRLARRCRRENPAPPLAPFLDRLIAELEEDREVLRQVTAAAGAAPSPVKEAAVVMGELAGRLKLNGRVLRYSELSRGPAMRGDADFFGRRASGFTLWAVFMGGPNKSGHDGGKGCCLPPASFDTPLPGCSG